VENNYLACFVMWHKVMRFLTKLQSLSAGDCYLILWANITLPIVGVRLRCQGFKQVYCWAKDQPTRKSPSEARRNDRPANLAKLINFAATTGLYRANCLCRSLVLLHVMQREGFSGELKLGVPTRSTGHSRPDLDAHAWVEYEGTVVNDHLDIGLEYVVFDLDLLN
jgi:hypothetical protein